jgi:hypothetical protein
MFGAALRVHTVIAVSLDTDPKIAVRRRQMRANLRDQEQGQAAVRTSAVHYVTKFDDFVRAAPVGCNLRRGRRKFDAGWFNSL